MLSHRTLLPVALLLLTVASTLNAQRVEKKRVAESSLTAKQVEGWWSNGGPDTLFISFSGKRTLDIVSYRVHRFKPTFQGEADLVGRSATCYGTEEEPECSMTFSFTKNRLRVTQQGPCYSAGYPEIGTYRRVRRVRTLKVFSPRPVMRKGAVKPSLPPVSGNIILENVRGGSVSGEHFSIPCENSGDDVIKPDLPE